jgi:hypothetical protein
VPPKLGTVTRPSITFASLPLVAGAPITYVSNQLGHATPTTTLRFYAKWIPSKGRRWVEVLDRAELRAEVNLGTGIWNQTGHNAQVVAQALEKLGEPSGTLRAWDRGSARDHCPGRVSVVGRRPAPETATTTYMS